MSCRGREALVEIGLEFAEQLADGKISLCMISNEISRRQKYCASCLVPGNCVAGLESLMAVSD